MKFLKRTLVFVFMALVAVLLVACGDKQKKTTTFKLTLPESVEVVSPADLNKDKVAKDTEVTIKVNVPEGQQVDKFTLGGEETIFVNFQRTFKVTKNTEVKVSFKDIDTSVKYTLTLGAGVSASEQTNIAYGTDVTLTITVPENQEIDELTVDGIKVNPVNNKFVLKVTRNHDIKVTFKKKGGSTTGISEEEFVYRATAPKINNAHPWETTMATKDEILGYISGELYRMDIDWERTNEKFPEVKKDDPNVWQHSAKFLPKWVPTLASSLPIPLDDEGNVLPAEGKTSSQIVASKWKIEIREGLKFEDGTPINAETYMYTFEQILDWENINARSADIFYEKSGSVIIKGTEDYHTQKDGKPVFDADGKPVMVQDLDEHGTPKVDKDGKPVMVQKTIKPSEEIKFSDIEGLKQEGNSLIITLEKETNLFKFAQHFSSHYFAPVPRAKYEIRDSATQKTTYGSKDNMPVSSGLYKIKTWDESKIVLVKNENYLPKDHIDSYKVKEIFMYQEESPTKEKEYFETGLIDQFSPMGEKQVEAYMNDKNYRQVPSAYIVGAEFNNGKKADGTPRVTSVPELRKAIYHAVNRDEWAKGPQRPAVGLGDYVSYTTLVTFEDFETIATYREEQKYKEFQSKVVGDTNGFSAKLAQEYFQQAITKLEREGIIAAGAKVEVQMLIFRAERNEASIKLLNDLIKRGLGELGKRFELVGAFAENDDQFYDKFIGGDYDLRFIIPGGGSVNAVNSLGRYTDATTQWSNRVGRNFYGSEMDTELVKISVPKTLAELEKRLAAEQEKATPNASLITQYNSYKDKATGGELELTLGAWVNFMGLISNGYEGKEAETVLVANEIQRVLLNHLPYLPLNYRMSAVVYSNAVTPLFKEYNSLLGYGGLQYLRSINKDEINAEDALKSALNGLKSQKIESQEKNAVVESNPYKVAEGDIYFTDQKLFDSIDGQITIAENKLSEIEGKKLTKEESDQVLLLIDNLHGAIKKYAAGRNAGKGQFKNAKALLKEVANYLPDLNQLEVSTDALTVKEGVIFVKTAEIKTNLLNLHEEVTALLKDEDANYTEENQNLLKQKAEQFNKDFMTEASFGEKSLDNVKKALEAMVEQGKAKQESFVVVSDLKKATLQIIYEDKVAILQAGKNAFDAAVTAAKEALANTDATVDTLLEARAAFKAAFAEVEKDTVSKSGLREKTAENLKEDLDETILAATAVQSQLVEVENLEDATLATVDNDKFGILAVDLNAFKQAITDAKTAAGLSEATIDSLDAAIAALNTAIAAQEAARKPGTKS